MMQKTDMRRWLMAMVVALVAVMPARALGRTFRLYNASNGLLDNSAQQVVSLPDGRILITTKGEINFFDGANFYNISGRHGKDFALKGYHGHYHLYLDKHDHYWLKNGGVVYCVDQKTEKYVNAGEELDKFNAPGTITDLYCTSDGCVWLIIDNKSVFGPDANLTVDIPSEHGELQDLDVYNRQYLVLFFSDGTVVVYDLKTKKIIHKSSPYQAAEAKKYDSSTFFCQRASSYYVFRNGGKEAVMMEFDMDTKKWTIITQKPYHLNNAAVEMGKRIFIATEYGLLIYDTQTGEMKQEPQLQLLDGQNLATDINCLCFDYQGGLWLGTEQRGVLYGRPQHTPFHCYKWYTPDTDRLWPQLASAQQPNTYNGQSVNCVYKNGNFTWVGSNDGVQIYRNGELVQTLRVAQGLPNNVVHSIIKASGMYWVSTSMGISSVRFNEKDYSVNIRNYRKEDGALNDQYMAGKIAKVSGGNIALQGLDYITEFNPKEVVGMVGSPDDQRNMLRPMVVALSVGGQNIVGGEEYDGVVITEATPPRSHDFRFRYDHANIMFIVSALNYHRPYDVYYRYRLLDSDDEEWKIAKPQDVAVVGHDEMHLHILFSNLEVGKYALEVEASTFANFKEAGKYTATVEIMQPWWRSTGLKLLLGLLALALIFLCVRQFQRNYALRVQQKQGDYTILERMINYTTSCKSSLGNVIPPFYDDGKDGIRPTSHRENQMLLFSRNIGRYETEKGLVTPDTDVDEVLEYVGFNRANIYAMAEKMNEVPRYRMAAIMAVYKAAHSLRDHRDKTIPEVMEECGFTDETFFRKCFEAFLGYSPETCRMIKKNIPY